MPSIEINSIAGKLIGNGACRGCVPDTQSGRGREKERLPCTRIDVSLSAELQFPDYSGSVPGSAKISFRHGDVVIEVPSRPRNPTGARFSAVHRRAE